MKTINTFIQKNVLILLAMIGIISMMNSCTEAYSNDVKAVATVNAEGMEIPKLFIRTGELSKSAEWDKTLEIVGNLEQKIKKDPSDLKSKLRLSEIYMNEARVTGEHGYYYPAILNILDGILSEKELDDELEFRALSLKSGVLLSLHEFGKAKELATRAVVLRPYNAQIYGALVDANVELGDYDEAVLQATSMMDLRPDLLSYARASYLREIHGDVEGAIEAMELAVSSGYPGNENSAWTRLTLGNIYENNGNLKEAEIEYQRTLLERPNYPFAIAAMGNLEAKKGNVIEAEKLLKQAIQIIPEVGFYITLAELYQDNGRQDETEATTKEIMDMLADDEAHGHRMDLEYAKVYLNLNNDAEAALKRAMMEYEARPANIDVNKILAKIYYKMGKIEEAEMHLAVAMRTRSEAYDLLTIAGLIQMKTGNTKQGKDLINRSMKINPYQSDQFSKEANSQLASR